MALQDFMLPSESIRYETSATVAVGSDKYRLLLTNRQLILYAKRGMFGRDDVLSWPLTDISHMSFREEGLIFKSGVLGIETKGGATQVRGKTHDLRACYLQARGGSA